MRTVQTNRSIKARNRKENSYKILLTFKDKKLMKKLLLSLVALVATVSMYADDVKPWQKSFTPVADAKDLAGVHVAQSPDGSVYVSSTQDAEFPFAGGTVPSAEITGAVIVKYGVDGTEQWATVLEGAATITAMDVAPNGTLYVAGTFTDVVAYTDAQQEIQQVESPDVISAFVGKVSANGGFAAFKQIKPEVDPVIGSAMLDGEYLYQMWDPIYVKPNKIQATDGYVYVSAFYMGDVPELEWDGAYIDFAGFMYMDDISAGVFYANTNLTEVGSYCTVQKTGVVSDTQSYPEAISFAAKGTSWPLIGFVGTGSLTLKSGMFFSEEDFSFTPGSHPLVVADLFSKEGPTVFNAAPHWKSAKPYNLFMELKADNELIVAGTTYGELPLDNTKTTGEATLGGDAPVYSLSYAPFVASLNVPENEVATVNWTQLAPLEAKAVKVVLSGDEIHAATDKGGFAFDAESGEMEGEKDVLFADVDAYANKYEAAVMVNENSVVVMNIEGENKEEKESTKFGYWTKSLKPVAEGANTELGGLHTAVATDGSVYASMTYNQEFQFAGSEIPAPEDNMTCAVVLKYSSEGKEEWAVTFTGAAEVTAMTTDDKGNLYVAVSHEGSVEVEASTTGSFRVGIDGGDWIESDVIKFSAEGDLLVAKNIAPQPDPALLATDMYYPEGLYFTVNKLKCHGNTLYGSASFNADVPEAGWQGAYIDIAGFLYVENRSKGIFAIDCETLSNFESVLTVQNAERISNDQFYPEALGFDIDAEGQVYYSFIGFGNLAVTPATGKAKNFTFNIAGDESGNKEHGLVVGKAAYLANSKVYSAGMNDNSYPTYDIKNMMVDGGTIYMGGTFYGNFWFWPSTTLDYNAAFSAKFSLNNDKVDSNWSDMESECTAYAFEGGNIILSSSTEGTALIGNGGDNRVISKVALDDVANFFTAANSYISHDGVKVYVSGRYNEEEAENILDGISSVAPAAAKKSVRYNLAGQRVNASYKGFIIEDGVTKYNK